MHPRTQATLAQLAEIEWFTNVGEAHADNVRSVSSWNEAIELCGSLEWENLSLEAANQYRERLMERLPTRAQEWNALVDLVKPAAEALVRSKTATIIERENLPKVFFDTVAWDILHLCMEAEYADVYPPGFYASQAYWYMTGRFPCGWEGDFPAGKLVIY